MKIGIHLPTVIPILVLYCRVLYVRAIPGIHVAPVYVVTGMRQTWKKLSFIRARCAIELALDAGVKRLQVEVAGQTVLPESPSPRPGTQGTRSLSLS